MVAAAVIGSAVVGGVVSSKASKGAAETQANSANAATAAQTAQFQQTQENVNPWLQAGQGALGQLSTKTLGGAFNPVAYTAPTALSSYAAGPDLTGQSVTAPTLQSATQGPTLKNVTAAPEMGKFASAGEMQTVTPAQLAAYEQYQKQNPYQARGDFTVDKFRQDPGYQFQLQQGLDALSNRSSVAGGLNSNNLKGLVGYAQGLADTSYQGAFNRYQTEAGRSLNEYETGLNSYIKQFMVGQGVQDRNNGVTQQNFANQVTGAGFNNGVTQQQYQNAFQTQQGNNANIAANLQNQIASNAFNNQNAQTGFNNKMQVGAFNNQTAQTGFNNLMQAGAFNNANAQQQFLNQNAVTGLNNANTQYLDANNLQRQQLNNSNLQQQFSNLNTLSQTGLGAGLQQGQIGANTAQSIGQNIIGAGNAQAAGQIGSANAITGAIGQGYNAYLQNQFMKPSQGDSFINSNSGVLTSNPGLTGADIYSAF